MDWFDEDTILTYSILLATSGALKGSVSWPGWEEVLMIIALFLTRYVQPLSPEEAFPLRYDIKINMISHANYKISIEPWRKNWFAATAISFLGTFEDITVQKFFTIHEVVSTLVSFDSSWTR